MARADSMRREARTMPRRDINLFFPYRPLAYETLTDVRNFVMPGDWLSTTDDKNGYWNCPIHPSSWTLLGFQWGGQTYCFTHLPFGVAPVSLEGPTRKHDRQPACKHRDSQGPTAVRTRSLDAPSLDACPCMAAATQLPLRQTWADSGQTALTRCPPCH